MRLKLYLRLTALFLISLQTLVPGQKNSFTKVTFKGEKNLTVTADLYSAPQGKSAPVILLFHQARTSRGEYRQIAPELVKMGFNCLAVDTRGGGKDWWNGVENETTGKAKKKNMTNTYDAAYLDMEAALRWVKDNKYTGKIIVWGSSFSASLVFRLASEHPKDISALLAFSPGEYFEGRPAVVASWAKGVKNIPVFVSCGTDERNRSKPVFDAVPGSNKTFYLPEKGGHGSSILMDDPERNWKPVKTFLEKLKQP